MDAGKKDNILWLDCIGGLIVGVLVLLACQLFSYWTGLSLSIILTIAFANLAYGGYSIWVTTRNPRQLIFVNALAIANMAWLLVCLLIVVFNWDEISIFGIIHVLGEGIYVATLGYTEWQWREALATSAVN